MAFDENLYLILVLRYKELFEGEERNGIGDESVPFDIVGYLTEIDTGKIDADYMNSRFNKYVEIMETEGVEKEIIEQVLNELHKSFASLTQEEQKYANIFLHDIQRGKVEVEKGKTLMDYITEYQIKASDEQIRAIVDALGLDEGKLRNMLNLHVTKLNLNEFGRFDELKSSVNKEKARIYFEKILGTNIRPYEVNMIIDECLQKFILEGNFEVIL